MFVSLFSLSEGPSVCTTLLLYHIVASGGFVMCAWLKPSAQVSDFAKHRRALLLGFALLTWHGWCWFFTKGKRLKGLMCQHPPTQTRLWISERIVRTAVLSADEKFTFQCVLGSCTATHAEHNACPDWFPLSTSALGIF